MSDMLLQNHLRHSTIIRERIKAIFLCFCNIHRRMLRIMLFLFCAQSILLFHDGTCCLFIRYRAVPRYGVRASS